MPDPVFADPRLAAVYDAMEGARDDLEAYVAMVEEFAARSVIDVGCGTGCLALRLSAAGVAVVGVDPAEASLAVARGKQGAAAVTWVHGDAPALAAAMPDLRADLAVMTGNVAQVFLTEDEWRATLRAVHSTVRPGGRLVFETRVPARRAWEGWNGPGSDVEVPGIGRVSDHYEVTGVEEGEAGDLFVSFRSSTVFHADGTTVASRSTLRFRDLDRIGDSLAAAGFVVTEVRDAPDRPGLEWVIVAERVAPVG